MAKWCRNINYKVEENALAFIDISEITCYNISIEGTTAKEPRVDRNYSLIRAIAHELVTPVLLLRAPLLFYRKGVKK